MNNFLLMVCRDPQSDVGTFQKLLTQAKEQGVDINQKFCRETLLHEAAESGHLSIVQDLLMGTGKEVGFTAINNLSDSGQTALMLACVYGHDLVAEELVAEGKAGQQAGVDVTKTDVNGATALHYATYNGTVNCVRILLSCTKPEDKKALIRAVDNKGRRALHGIECSSDVDGNGETVVALIEGMDDEEDRRWIVNALDNKGETALFEVTRNYKAGTIRKLLEMGRRYGRGGEDGGGGGDWGDRRNLEGKTVLHVAISRDHGSEEDRARSVLALICPKWQGEETTSAKRKESGGDGGGESGGGEDVESEAAEAMETSYEGGVDVNMGCSKRTQADDED